MKKISMRGTNYYLTSFNCMYLLSYLSNIFKKRENWVLCQIMGENQK